MSAADQNGAVEDAVAAVEVSVRVTVPRRTQGVEK